MAWSNYGGYSGWNTAAYRRQQPWPVWKAFVLEFLMPGASWAYLGKWAVAFGVMVAAGVIGGIFGGLAGALASAGAGALGSFVRLLGTPAVIAWYWYNASKTHAFAPVEGGAKRAAAWILGWYAVGAALVVCGLLFFATALGAAAGRSNSAPGNAPAALAERGQAASVQDPGGGQKTGSGGGQTQVGVMVSPPAPRVGDTVTFEVFALNGKVQCVVMTPELAALVDVLYGTPAWSKPVGRGGAWGVCWEQPVENVTLTAEAVLSGRAGEAEASILVMDSEGQWWQVGTAISVQP